MNFIGDFVGSQVIINFIEPNVANRRGVLSEANEIFVRLETSDGKNSLSRGLRFPTSAWRISSRSKFHDEDARFAGNLM